MITNLISMGYAASEILNFIGKKVKNLNKGIEEARFAGHNDDDILKFISGKIPKGKKKEVDQVVSDQEQYLKNIGIKTKQERQESTRKGLNTALSVGATALGAYGLYKQYASKYPRGEWDFNKREVPQDAMQIEGQSQPQIGYNPGLEKGPKGPNQFQMIPGNVPIQPSQQVIKNAKQPGIQPLNPPSSIPAVPSATNVVDPEKYLKDKGLLDQVNTMLQAGNKPEQITALLSAKNTSGRLRGGEDAELLQAIQNYTQKKSTIVNEEKILQDQGTSQELQLDNTSEETTQTPKTEKPKAQERGNVVSLSNGEIGIIDDLKKDHAVVEVNGKKKPVKLDEIEELPISQKDLADMHDELIAGMQKETGQDVSRNVMWAGYDPEKNQLKYLPWDGDLYTYDDISPDIVERLTNLLTQRKSSGKNFIGPWVAGTASPIGAAMYQIIKELQSERGGKGKEYSGKAKPIYSAYEPSIKASKEKEKKRREEEKRRKQERR